MGIQVIGTTGQSSTIAEVDSAHKALRVEPRPLPVAYSGKASAQSGTVAAGASADSPVFAFRNPSTVRVVAVKSLRMSVHTLGTGFTAGVAIFYVKVASVYTALATGGTAVTLTTVNGKKRFSHSDSLSTAMIANTGALTGGSGATFATTKSAFRVDTFSTAVQTVLTQDAEMLNFKQGGDYPIVLAQDQGFELFATVPATGTWVLTVNMEWDEIALADFAG